LLKHRRWGLRGAWFKLFHDGADLAYSAERYSRFGKVSDCPVEVHAMVSQIRWVQHALQFCERVVVSAVRKCRHSAG
jgi:hypothetical protein